MVHTKIKKEKKIHWTELEKGITKNLKKQRTQGDENEIIFYHLCRISKTSIFSLIAHCEILFNICYFEV